MACWSGTVAGVARVAPGGGGRQRLHRYTLVSHATTTRRPTSSRSPSAAPSTTSAARDTIGRGGLTWLGGRACRLRQAEDAPCLPTRPLPLFKVRRGHNDVCPTLVQLHVTEELLELFDTVFDTQPPPKHNTFVHTIMAILDQPSRKTSQPRRSNSGRGSRAGKGSYWLISADPHR